MVLETLFLKLIHIVDFGHRHDRKAAKMGIHHDRLCIRVTDDANTDIALEFTDSFSEFCPEIGILYVMDRAVKNIIMHSNHTASFRSQVRMIVYAIKQIG